MKKLYEFIKINDDITSIKRLKENYPKIEANVFNEILKTDPTYNGGSNESGKFTNWILSLFNQGNLKQEDFYKVKEYLGKFVKYKAKMKNKDINSYRTLPDLAKALDEVESLSPTKSEVKRNIKKTDLSEDAELVASTSKYNIYVPKTYEASCKLGAGTHWCTASNSSRDYYDRYSSQGPLYILIDKSDNKPKYQLHFESGSFMNDYDAQRSFEDIIGDDKELSDFIVKKLKSNTEYVDRHIEDIIEAPFAEEFIDEIRDCCDRTSWLIDEVMKNSKLHKYFEKEIEDELKKHSYKASYFIWDKELALGKYKKACMECLGFKDGINQIKIDNDYFAPQLESFSKEKDSRDYLSERFFKSCLSGEMSDIFDNYYEGEVNRWNFESDIDDDVKKLLNQLHLEYKNIPQNCIDSAVYEGNLVGAEDECYKDFTNAMTDAAKGIPFELGYDHSLWSLTYEQYLDLIYKFKDEDEYEVDCKEPSDFIIWYVAKDFDLREPYYGWNDFSEEAFNDRLYDELWDSIVNVEEDPEFDDDEELDKWREWFENEYKKK